MESLLFFLYKIISPINKDRFTSSFPIWAPLFLFLAYSLARTSNTVFNWSGESQHSYLVSDLKTFSLSPLSIMLTVGLSHMTFIVLRYVLCILTLLNVFIMKGYGILSIFFLPLLR